MGLAVVGNLIAHARQEGKRPAVLELSMKLAFGAQKDVTLEAPVISQVTRGVLDGADA